MRFVTRLTTLLGLLIVFCYSAHAANPLLFREAFAIACRNNPDLQAAIDQAEVMRGLFIQSGLYPNPEVAIMGENFGGSGIYSSYESAETTASVTQPIPLGGRLSYQKKAAHADYEAALAAIEAQKATLYVEVGTAYVDVFYADQWHRVTRKLVRLNQNIVDAIARRVKAGAGAELDLRLAEVRLGDAEIQEQKAARDVKALRAELLRRMGGGMAIDRPLADKGLQEVKLDWSQLLKSIPKSPLMRQMHRQLAARQNIITAVKKSVWPDLNIQLGARHFSDDGENAAVVSAFAKVPVFDRNQGKIHAAHAQFTQTAHEYQSVKLDVQQRAYTLFLAAQQSHYEVDKVTKSLLPLAHKSIKLAQEGYQMGRYSYIELSLAINTLYEEERHYQQAHADYHKSLIQLTGLLGLHPARERT